jgi:hypothetical protein
MPKNNLGKNKAANWAKKIIISGLDTTISVIAGSKDALRTQENRVYDLRDAACDAMRQSVTLPDATMRALAKPRGKTCSLRDRGRACAAPKAPAAAAFSAMQVYFTTIPYRQRPIVSRGCIPVISFCIRNVYNVQYLRGDATLP